MKRAYYSMCMRYRKRNYCATIFIINQKCWCYFIDHRPEYTMPPSALTSSMFSLMINRLQSTYLMFNIDPIIIRVLCWIIYFQKVLHEFIPGWSSASPPRMDCFFLFLIPFWQFWQNWMIFCWYTLILSYIKLKPLYTLSWLLSCATLCCTITIN